MSEETIFQLIKDKKELTSLPQVLAEVIRVTEKEECGAHEISEVIMKDPALSVRLLRIANSAFYGPSREVSTVSQAVLLMGVRSVKALALSVGLYHMFDREQVVIDRLRFWRHSLEVAIACREIARLCAYNPPEEAFVTGLLHDIGILIMEASYEDQLRRIWKLVEAGESLVKLEETTWGTNHARVAKFLLDQWRVPDLIGEAIGVHHDSFDAEKGHLPHNRLSRIICLANRISKYRVYTMPPAETEEEARIEELAESLGIGATTLAELQENVVTQLMKESEFLDIPIGSPLELLKEANAQIYKQYLLIEAVLRENRRMQAEVARDQVKKAALESLKTITATLSHYINNASATILGRAQLVELAVEKGTVVDERRVASNSMDVIVKSVETISLVLEELKKLSSFEVTHYHDETDILDIEDRLREQIAIIDAKKAKANSLTQ